MRQLLYISLLAIVLIPVGCKTTQKSVQSTDIVRDTLEAVQESRASRSTDTSRHTMVTDTTVGIKAKSLADTVEAAEMELPRTKDGKAVARHWQKYQDGVRVYASLDTNGNLTYGCDVDSLTLVIKGLIRESVNIQGRYDSLASAYGRRATVQASRREVIQTVSPTWWGKYWKLVIAGVLGIVLLLFTGRVSGFFKWIKPRKWDE